MKSKKHCFKEWLSDMLMWGRALAPIVLGIGLFLLLMAVANQNVAYNLEVVNIEGTTAVLQPNEKIYEPIRVEHADVEQLTIGDKVTVTYRTDDAGKVKEVRKIEKTH